LRTHDLATQHILDLEERNKELRARFTQELERLRSINRVVELDDNSPSNPDGLDAPIPPSPSTSHQRDFSFSPETDFVMDGYPNWQALPNVRWKTLAGFVDAPSLD